jgi:hypothetical protein
MLPLLSRRTMTSPCACASSGHDSDQHEWKNSVHQRESYRAAVVICLPWRVAKAGFSVMVSSP